MKPDMPPLDPRDLPTLRQLRVATVGALLGCGVLLVVAVLPAEAAYDPTGLGDALGLLSLGEIKSQAHAEPDTSPAPEAAAALPVSKFPVSTFRQDEVTVTLAPGAGTEVKAQMTQGNQLLYSWASSGHDVFFDFHGEPHGAAADVFTSFETGTQSTAQGTFDAPFTGVHGWYWKNQGSQLVTVTVTTSGMYASIGQK